MVREAHASSELTSCAQGAIANSGECVIILTTAPSVK